MSADAWITTAVLVVTFGLLIWDRLPPSGVVLGATTSLLLLDVIDASQAFAGFSNPAPLTVAALYVVAAAVQRTGMLAPLSGWMLGRHAKRHASARLLVPVGAASAIFNNTPLLAMLIPDVVGWCRRHGVAPSRFLLPMSYAAILGGTLTVLGTSTNLLVSGLVEEVSGDALGVFELAKVGGAVAVVGFAYLLIAAPRLTPDRQGAVERTEAEAREFVFEMEVEADGAVAGHTVESAGLRDLRSVYLVEIRRRDELIAPVEPDDRLEPGDHLSFVGGVEQVLDLQQIRGLRNTASDRSLIEERRLTFHEAVIGRESPVAGRTLKESRFRERYGAAVIAVHRAGHRIDGKLGDVRLRHGDTLVLLAGAGFQPRWRDRRDFLVVAPLDAPPPTATERAPLVAAVVALFVVTSAAGVLSTLEGALVAAGLLVLARVLTFSDAKKAIDLDVVILIGAAFGLGAAVESSGLADDIANGFTTAFDGLGTFGLVLGVVLATSVLTEIVTNNAAAVVVFPIALGIADSADVDPRLMAITVAIAASTSFITPIGYQTNTMVYGPGGYRFVDYARLGLPLSICVQLTIAATVTLLSTG